MISGVTESVVEDVALAWLEILGWQGRHGAEITPGGPAAERDDFEQVVQAQRLRGTLLPKIISGALRVTDAEKFMEARP